MINLSPPLPKLQIQSLQTPIGTSLLKYDSDLLSHEPYTVDEREKRIQILRLKSSILKYKNLVTACYPPYPNKSDIIINTDPMISITAPYAIVLVEKSKFRI